MTVTRQSIETITHISHWGSSGQPWSTNTGFGRIYFTVHWVKESFCYRFNSHGHGSIHYGTRLLLPFVSCFPSRVSWHYIYRLRLAAAARDTFDFWPALPFSFYCMYSHNLCRVLVTNQQCEWRFWIECFAIHSAQTDTSRRSKWPASFSHSIYIEWPTALTPQTWTPTEKANVNIWPISSWIPP